MSGARLLERALALSGGVEELAERPGLITLEGWWGGLDAFTLAGLEEVSSSELAESAAVQPTMTRPLPAPVRRGG